MAVFNVLLSRGVNRGGDGGIIEGAVARSGPLQVVVMDGVTHDLSFAIFANGDIITSSTSHHTLSGQADKVDPNAIAATSGVLVFGVGPLVGMSSSSDRIRSFGPRYIARPIVLFLVVDVEMQLVVAAFRRHFVVEGDAVV